MAISPSGIGYFDTKPEDVVVMDLNGDIIEGWRKPSSEWALHTAMYKAKPGLSAITRKVDATTKWQATVLYGICNASPAIAPCPLCNCRCRRRYGSMCTLLYIRDAQACRSGSQGNR